MQHILFATTNENKMKEIKEILGDLGMEVMSLKEAGIYAEVEENGQTFEENALIKAREIASLVGGCVLADDSGLEVDYINKEPGIYSARYMGEDTSYHIKNHNIIERLEKAKGAERSARFVCAIACVMPDGTELVVRGTIEGEIGQEEIMGNGFGYDPIFYVPEYHMTLSQMSREDKNKISHRGKALREMRQLIKNYLKN